MNLLAVALSLVGRQTVVVRRFVSLGTTAAGNPAPTFATAETVSGSFQPLSAAMVQTMGLDLGRAYATFWSDVAPPLEEVNRGRAGDRVIYGGEIYEVHAPINWTASAGWRGVILGKVADA